MAAQPTQQAQLAELMAALDDDSLTNPELSLKLQIGRLYNLAYNNATALARASTLTEYADWQETNASCKGHEQWVTKIARLRERGEEDMAFAVMRCVILYCNKDLTEDFSWCVATVLPTQDFKQGLPEDKAFILGRFAAIKGRNGTEILQKDLSGDGYILWWNMQLTGTAQGQKADHVLGGLQRLQRLAVETKGEYGQYVRLYYFRGLPAYLNKLMADMDALAPAVMSAAKKESERQVIARAHKLIAVINQYNSQVVKSTCPITIAKVRKAHEVLQIILKERIGNPQHKNDVTNFMQTATSLWDNGLLETSIHQAILALVMDSNFALYPTAMVLGPNARQVTYRPWPVAGVPVTEIHVSIGHVCNQAFNVFKWRINRVGAGVIADKPEKGKKKKSPAANNQSKQYKAFCDRVKSISGITASVYDFSRELVPILTGVENIPAGVYIQPPAAILDYVQDQYAAGDDSDDGEDGNAMGVDQLLEALGIDDDDAMEN